MADERQGRGPPSGEELYDAHADDIDAWMKARNAQVRRAFGR
jgi:hypothetical protein